MNPWKFAPGDEVRWESQSAGRRKLKVGRVAACVEAGADAYEATSGSRGALGSQRSTHDRYVVRVGSRWYAPLRSVVERYEAAREPLPGPEAA